MLLIMVNINKALGNNIRALRKKKELTQEELAYKAELDYSYINQIENGKRNPSMDAVERIAKALGTKVQNLLNF
jgi:transcriptional regulator with XRE-family HTH domain